MAYTLKVNLAHWNMKIKYIDHYIEPKHKKP